MIVLRPYQQPFADYFDRGGTRGVSVWHRRAGKDLVALRQTYRAALQRVGVYWYMLPSYSQARKVIWRAKQGGRSLLDIVFPREAVAGKNESEMFIELKNGSLIQFVGSDNYDSLVGSNALGFVFSEYALAKPQAWQYLRPIAKENGAWVAWASTPRGRNHLHKVYEIGKADPSWFAEVLDIHATKALPLSTLDDERREGMPEALVNSEYLCSFDAAQIGAVYGDLLEALAKRNGIATWDTKGAAKVFTTWDLGMGDATAIWWWAVEGERIDVLDYYEANGKPFSHYADVIEARGHRYEGHFFPHDARQRNYQTGVTTLDLARERLGPGVSHLPIMPVAQGIEAARWLLQQPIRVHEKQCEAGLEALRAYSYEFDEDKRTFSDRPAHTWASHGADGFRYLATAARAMIRMLRPEPKPEPKPLRVVEPTLDEMWEEYDRAREAGERI